MERKNKDFGERLKKRMVHKKYIKRGDKVFGPYLYENYREKGVIKTRYLGKDDSKKREKLHINKTFFIVLSIIFIVMIFVLILFLSEKNLFETGENLKGELFTEKFLNILNLLLGIKETLKGELPSENVNVFVNIVDNSPPEIGNVQDEILVCENKPLSYFFNVSDADGIDEVTVGISDIEPFFVRLKRKIDDFYGEYEIFSWGNLIKKDIDDRRVDAQGWATYPETITANDGKEADSSEINITIIEVNNPPKFSIGTKTVDLYTKGENNVFYYDLGAYLEENFEETPTENLTFNLTFLNGTSFFNISNRGIINVTGNESFILPGQNSTTYWVNISVYDKGLSTITHPSISLCFPDDNESRYWSDDFRITVTKENRAPIITSYYPLNLSLFITGSKDLYFNISARDPDRNPVDVYWYVDDVQKEYFEALYENNLSKFEYIFGCGIPENHTVKSVVTDGLLNASVQWNLSIEYTECAKPQPPGGGGGGGGIGKLYCEEKWGCNDWMQCQNLNELVKGGWTSKETELLIKERCGLFNYSGEFCGFQTRICTDFNYCNLSFNKPGIIRECYFTENPNCTDGIKNCHDGKCEVLADCGGPCIACPTCSDKIQNQGEERIDCGGPCEPCKELPFRPVLFKSIVSYSLIALLILVLVLVIKEIKEYYSSKERVEKGSIKNLIKQEKKTYVYRALFIIFVVLLLFFANIYITKFTQESIISGVSKIGEGALASYGFINNLIKSIGIFFISGVLENENSKLQIWDDTDNIDRFTICSQYCYQKEKPFSNLWTVYFYANYVDKISGGPLSGGACEIRFEDENRNYGAWENMVYNSFSKFFEYFKQFSYKGDYNFEVNCSYGLYSIAGEEGFEITNTAPYIIKTAAGYIDLDADGEKEAWQCFEDSVCYYNFSANVSEDDMNDELIFGYLPTGNTTLTNFKINSSSGILEINITHSSYTGNGKKVELSVLDTERTASAILEVNVQDVNDAPIFVNLTDKIFNTLDLFEYAVYVTDEENNVPFKFNISFVNCSNLASRGNCTLFDYSVDEMLGRINISFIPSSADIGNYVINFSVMDNSSLGNKTTSQLVNFSVNRALWKTPLSLEHILTEDKEFYLNLSENVTSENITFFNNSGFYSFNLASNGIINFTPVDEDVGYHEVEIVASDLQTSSPKTFNFSVLNINDNPSIKPLNVEGAVVSLLNITAFENANVKIYLFVQDNDFLIPQKSFYNENLNMNLTIEGVDINTTLFKFVFDSVNGNQARYIAGFIPRDFDVGNYSITINVTDKSNSSDVLKFSLTIIDRNYDTPVINYPDVDYEFNLKENVSFNLTFRANHTIGDNLTYKFYINDELRNSLNYYGDNKNLTWQFTPNFTDETYNETKNLKLLVLNPFFPEINASRSWNLTINHTNAPPELIRDIGDKVAPYNYAFQIDLKQYFLDIDHEDSHYNQSVSFVVSSNSSPSYITISEISEEWTFVLSSSKFSPYSEILNITAYDLNETGESMTQVTSNNFKVEFIEPPTVQVPVSTPSGGGGGGSEKIISLKIIIPGKLSAYEHEKIDIPLSLINAGETSFNDLTLTSSAFKDGNISKEVNASLNKNYFKSLNPGQKEDLNLTVFFDTDKIGDYEILVNVTSKSPKYTDWGKIHINLQKINESQVRELIVFTEEFIVKNPQCIEIEEIVKEAEKLFGQGDYANAKIKSEQAIEACKESISQISVPKKKTNTFGISLYLIFTILLAFVLGIAYYFFKRRKIQKMKIQEVKLRAMQEVSST